MSAPVQAQSISSLNGLLANPPRYPRNPTHEAHDPLVLYIVRVPGSKDVFLTPLKPPTKASISIEAVQSSLYFLHVERPEDDDLRRSLEAHQVAEKRAHDNSQVQRKPLPKTRFANYPASQRPPTPPKSYPNYQPPIPGSNDASQAARHAARGTHLRFAPQDGARSTRVPAGARPMPGRRYSDESTSSTDRDMSSSASPVEGVQRKPLPNGLPVISRTPAPDVATGSGNGGIIPPAAMDQLRHGAPGLHLSDLRGSGLLAHPGVERITLIRRDPASGGQWNVGTIYQGGETMRDVPLQSVNIELTSPGYGQFAESVGAPVRIFQRKVGYMQLPSFEGLGALERPRSNSIDAGFRRESPNRKPRQAYSFTSPWQGQCVFSNGLDGRSLRCKHTLPAATPSIPGVTADVAELRFNLPWSILRPKDVNKQANGSAENIPVSSPANRPTFPSKRAEWRHSFQSLTNKARTQLSQPAGGEKTLLRPPRRDIGTPDSSDQEGRLDLALGREKAGGGFQGQSAKLGKLIIEDEGLKMCDLIVAACMGVWWQHYSGEKG